MTKAQRRSTTTPDTTTAESRTKAKEDRELSSELEMSFPASDPPASVQPGSGVTGPEVAKK